MENLLNLQLNEAQEQLSEEEQKLFNEALHKQLTTSIKPQHGFVLKTRSVQSTAAMNLHEKLFINICHSSELPFPFNAKENRSWTQEEIDEAMEGVDNGYRLAVSLSSGLRGCRDAKNQACHLIDACVNSDILKQAMKKGQERFHGFLCHLCLAIIEERHGLVLSREFTLPKMLVKDHLEEHQIYKTNFNSSKAEKKDVLVKSATAEDVEPQMKVFLKQPDFQLIEEPSSSAADYKEWPEYLIMTIDVPMVKNPQEQIKLELSHMGMVFTMGELYRLQHSFDVPVQPGQSGAEYNHSLKQVTVTMPVMPLPESFQV